MGFKTVEMVLIFRMSGGSEFRRLGPKYLKPLNKAGRRNSEVNQRRRSELMGGCSDVKEFGVVQRASLWMALNVRSRILKSMR